MRFGKIALWAVPALFLASQALLLFERGSFATNHDPDYAYLFNSLTLATGGTPGHTDHPGTTVQEVGASAIWFYHMIGPSTPDAQKLPAAALKAPEEYLTAIWWMLHLVEALGFWLVGFLAFHRFSLRQAILLQAAPLLPPGALWSFATVSPESFIMLASGIAALLFYLFVRAGEEPAYSGRLRDWQASALFGVVLGFGFVSKITFLPIFIALFFLPQFASRRVALIAAFVTTAALLSPVWSRLPATLIWINSLFAHAGNYGSGPATIFTWSELPARMVQVVKMRSSLFVSVLAFGGARWLLLRDGAANKGSALARVLAAAVGISVFQILMCLKHPGTRYFYPASQFATIALVLAIFELGRFARVTASRMGRLRHTVLLLALLAVALESGIEFARTWQEHIDYRVASTAAIDAVRAAIAKQPECLVAPYYPAPDMVYALEFGSTADSDSFRPELAKLYDRYVFFNIWQHTFRDFKGDLPIAEMDRRVADGACILLFGGSFARPDFAEHKEGLDLEPIYDSGDLAVHRLRRITWR